METRHKNLIVVVGPTGVGKTALSIKIAKRLDCEIISADSRQIYKEMEIGTAKPTASELNLAKHHFINSHSIKEEYSAGKFEADCLKILENIFLSQEVAVMVGGSGLYVDAVCKGMDAMPEIDGTVRQEFNKKFEEQGLEELLRMLASVDPEYYTEVDKKNPQRVIRALEVFYTTGTPYSNFRQKLEVDRPFKIIKLGLTLPREELYQRIDQRMDQMIEAGLFDEAASLLKIRHLNALQTVGYTEIFDYFDGKYDKAEAVRLLKRNSRRYAKRQLTWFRRDPEITWFSPTEEDRIFEFLASKLHL